MTLESENAGGCHHRSDAGAHTPFSACCLLSKLHLDPFVGTGQHPVRWSSEKKTNENLLLIKVQSRSIPGVNLPQLLYVIT